MSLFEVTTYGEKIAGQSGLESLVDQLGVSNLDSPLISHLANMYVTPHEEPERVEADAIKNGLSKLRTEEEKILFERGLNINPTKSTWRRIGELAPGTLFPQNLIKNFMPATEEDRFILSGIVGLELIDFSQSCHLLNRIRYQEYGFDNFIESCAFVGAYVINLLSETPLSERPFFSFNENGLTHKISIGGTSIGDFLMTEDRTINSQIISPINRKTEFSPINTIDLMTEQSVEPAIVESMLVHELLRGGKKSLTMLVNEFTDICRPYIGFKDKVRFLFDKSPEYIRDEIDNHTRSIQILLKDKKLKDEQALYSYTNPAQFKPEFSIISLEHGIRFQNEIFSGQEQNPTIDIDRKYFGELFRTVLLQTQDGLGRSTPNQIIEYITAVNNLLENY